MTTGRTAQLLLDHLLALSINARGGRQGRFVILYPAANTAVEKQVIAYKRDLSEHDETFQSLTLEDLVANLRTVLNEPWLEEIQARYLDVAAIDRLDTAID